MNGKRGIFGFDFPHETFMIASEAREITKTDSKCGTLNLLCYSNTWGYKSAQGKLYSAKVYDNGTLIRDFVPCTSPSGAIGLYDLEGKAFYENTLTGAFTAGPAV